MIDYSIPLQTDAFTHIRVVIGIIMGLSLTRLLTGLSRFIHTPRKNHASIVHIGWTLYMLVCLLNFWWFQITLSNVVAWSFEYYAFVLFYASLYFFTCALLYPDNIEKIDRMDEYFLSRRVWFYGLLIGLNLVDVLDSFLKGVEYLQALGAFYVIHTTLFLVASVYAIRSTDRRFHKLFVLCAILADVCMVLISDEVLT